MLASNVFPILEYDDNPLAVLMPGHDAPGLRLPPRVAFPFVGDCVAEYAEKRGLPVLELCLKAAAEL